MLQCSTIEVRTIIIGDILSCIEQVMNGLVIGTCRFGGEIATDPISLQSCWLGKWFQLCTLTCKLFTWLFLREADRSMRTCIVFTTTIFHRSFTNYFLSVSSLLHLHSWPIYSFSELQAPFFFKLKMQSHLFKFRHIMKNNNDNDKNICPWDINI